MRRVDLGASDGIAATLENDGEDRETTIRIDGPESGFKVEPYTCEEAARAWVQGWRACFRFARSDPSSFALLVATGGVPIAPGTIHDAGAALAGHVSDALFDEADKALRELRASLRGKRGGK